jgi:hypothetical protein
MANETELEQTSTEDSNQTAEDASEQTETDSQKLYEVNGQQWTPEELHKNYVELQKEFTRRSQTKEPAKVETSIATEKPVAESDEALAFIKSLGFVHQKDIEAVEQQKAAEKKLDALVASNPVLANYKDAIRQIAKTDNSAYEDIVVKYGFSQKDKLNVPRYSDVMGEAPARAPTKEKTIEDMDPAEYEAWRQQNLRKR